MTKILLALLLISPVLTYGRGTHVRGYTKRNGTRVAPYRRSEANGTRMDNYSHRGNVNPYTGKVGTKN